MKHYIFLLLWWLSLGYTLDSNSAILGLILCFLFFLISSAEILKKSFIAIILVFIATAIFPPLAGVVAILSLIFFLRRLNFLANNWRALLVGMYAYGVYLLVVIFNGFFYETIVAKAAFNIAIFFNSGSDVAITTFGYDGVEKARLATGYIKQALQICSYAFPAILTIIFHKQLKWLYKYNYTTDKAFHIIGITPLITLAIVLPFLKIDVGDYEIFSGTFSDNVDSKISLPEPDLPDKIDTLIEAANVDIGNWLDTNATSYSPIIEASMAALATKGLYTLHKKYAIKDLKIKLDCGEELTLQNVEDKIIVKNKADVSLCKINNHKDNSVEEILLSDDKLTINNNTGQIKYNSEIIGNFKTYKDEKIVLKDKENNIIREYNINGNIYDSNMKIIGSLV